uniref:Ribosomal protein L16 n=1 Tax=Babesia rodhaini TaxID=5870 RepID=A0A455R061_BABRO|nr:ribosomal protein L16 [Babesia rodhaini]
MINNILFPKFYKYKKVHNKKCNLSNKLKIIKLIYGTYGFVSKNFGYISSNQLEAIRNIINKNIKKISKPLFYITPNLPILKKSKSSRMGSGAGNILNSWFYRVNPGSVIAEVYDINYKYILNIFNSVSCRVPFKICLVKKERFNYEEY